MVEHSLYASYTGDSNFASSKSTALAVAIATTATLTASCRTAQYAWIFDNVHRDAHRQADNPPAPISQSERNPIAAH